MAKVEVKPERWMYPRPTLLVGANIDGKANFMTVGGGGVASAGPPMIAAQKIEFQGWYRREYLEAWYAFAAEFTKGVERLEGREEWQRMATKVAAGQGPYLALLDRMALELEPMVEGGDLSPWLEPVRIRFPALRP